MKKLRLFIIIGFVAAIVISIGVYSLVSYLNYMAYYNKMMSTLFALI